MKKKSQSNDIFDGWTFQLRREEVRKLFDEPSVTESGEEVFRTPDDCLRVGLGLSPVEAVAALLTLPMGGLNQFSLKQEFREITVFIQSFLELRGKLRLAPVEQGELAKLQIEAIRKIFEADAFGLNKNDLIQIAELTNIKAARAHGYLLAWLVKQIEGVVQPKDIRRKHHHQPVKITIKTPKDISKRPLEYDLEEKEVLVYFAIQHNERVIVRQDLSEKERKGNFVETIETYFEKGKGSQNTIQAIVIDMYLRAIDKVSCHRPTPKHILREMREFLDENSEHQRLYAKGCVEYLKKVKLLPFPLQLKEGKRRKFPKEAGDSKLQDEMGKKMI